MESGLYIAIVALAVIVIGLFVYRSYKKEKARKAALGTYAAAHGFTMTERDDSLLQRWGESVRPFNEGFDKRCANVMRGTWDGRPAVQFDSVFNTLESHTDSDVHTHQ
jgi:hypothetical protein